MLLFTIWHSSILIWTPLPVFVKLWQRERQRVGNARTLQMNSDWFHKFSDYFLTTFRGNFPLFSDQSWQKFLLWVTKYCQRRINTHRSLWMLIINWNHVLFGTTMYTNYLFDWLMLMAAQGENAAIFKIDSEILYTITKINLRISTKFLQISLKT